jgi:CDP-glucose 4,6-dehydratase
VFNFSCEQPVTVLDLVARILDAMGSDLEPDVRNEASNEIRDQYLDASKARTMLGWSPAFTFETGLRATIDWYMDYFAARAATPELETSRG